MTSAIIDGQTSIFAGIWFWTYLFAMIFLILNMFVAITVWAFLQHQGDRPADAHGPAALEAPALVKWLNPVSIRAWNCLTIMEAIPTPDPLSTRLGCRSEPTDQEAILSDAVARSVYVNLGGNQVLVHRLWAFRFFPDHFHLCLIGLVYFLHITALCRPPFVTVL